MADRKLSITITGDAKSANKALDSLNKGLGKTEKASSGLSDGIKSGLAIGGVAAIGAFAKSSIDAASDLSESVSKTKVVFGEASKSVLTFGKDAADSMGMSEQEALSAAGTFGNLLRSIGLTEKESAKMSMSMVDLSADLASFNNVPTAEALEAIRAGLVGETEPLKKFGVNINEAALKAKALEMGLSDGKATLDANAKAQASYALIMEQTTLAQGDFERTSSGLANQQKILAANFDDAKASLGEGLMPAMQTAVTVAGSALDAFTALPAVMQQTVVLGGAGAIAWAQWGDGVKSAAGKAKDFASTLGKVGAFAGPAAAGIAVLGGAFLAYKGQQEKAKQAAEEWNAEMDGMRETAESTGQTIQEVFVSQYVQEWASKNRDALLDAGINLDELKAKLSGSKEDWTLYWAEVAGSMDDPGNAAGLDPILVKLLTMRGRLEETKGAAKDYKATAAELGIENETAAASTEALGEATGTTKEKFDAVKTAIDEAAQGVRDWYDATTSGIENTIAFESSLDSFTESVGTNGRTLDVTTEAGRKNQQALIAMKEAAVQSAAAIVQQTGDSKAGAFALTGYANSLAQTARDAGYSEKEIRDMLGQMGLTPELIPTVFANNAKPAEQAVRELNNEIARVKSYVPVRISVYRDGPAPRAEGGPVKRGMPYLVGEEGPEMVTFPGDGMVHTAKATRKMLNEDQRGWNWKTMGNNRASKDIMRAFGNGLVGDVNQDGSISDREWLAWNHLQNQNRKDPAGTLKWLQAANRSANASRESGKDAIGVSRPRGASSSGGDTHIHIHAGMLGSEQQVISWVAKGLRDAQARAGSRKILAGTA